MGGEVGQATAKLGLQQGQDVPGLEGPRAGMPSGQIWIEPEHHLGSYPRATHPKGRLGMCTKSFIYFSSCAHSRIKLARTTHGS